MRLVLRFSTWRTVHGFRVGASAEGSAAEIALNRVAEALDLIKDYSPRRFARLRRHFSQFWSVPLDGAVGRYYPDFRMCALDLPYLARVSVTAAEAAGIIVHELTHARLEALGIETSEGNRARVERLCHLEQSRFLACVPGAHAVAEDALSFSTLPDATWSDAALNDVYLHGFRAMLHHLGYPAWLIAAWVHVRRLTRRLRGQRAA
jgi:hypothetical protein